MKTPLLKFKLLVLSIFTLSLSFGQNVTITNATGTGLCDGSATLSNSGLYNSWSWWSDTIQLQNGGTTVSNLCAGVYVLNYTDSSGSSTYSFAVGTDSSSSQCSSFSISMNTQSTAQNICNGTASVVMSGGVAPFAFSWSNGSTTASLSNLCNGYYEVTVVDVNGCSQTASGNVFLDSVNANLNALNVTANTINSSGNCDGSVQLTVNNGVPPYIFNHSNGATTATVNNLCEGVYDVSIMDANGDSTSISYLISSPSNSTSTINFQDSTLLDTIYSQLIDNCSVNYSSIDSVIIDNVQYLNNDSVDVIWAIYYNGTDIAYINNIYVLNSGIGVYSITLTMSCSFRSLPDYLFASDQLYFNEGIAASIDDNSQIIISNFYPNPVKNYLTLELNSNIEHTIDVYNISGQNMYTTTESANQISIDLSKLSAGSYLLVVKNEYGQVVEKIIK